MRNGHTYTPKRTRNAEAFVKLMAVQAMAGRLPIEEPVALMVHLTVAIPASWSKRRRQAAAGGEAFPAGKPDLDNLVKLVSDALNSVVVRDDAQIVRLVAEKAYGTQAGTLITVQPLQTLPPGGTQEQAR